MVYYTVSVLFLLFFWCPCMAINVSVQYNGGLLPDIILLTQGYYHWGTRLNTMYCSGFVFTAYVIVYYYYHVGWCTTLSLFCFYCFSGVPAWRLM